MCDDIIDELEISQQCLQTKLTSFFLNSFDSKDLIWTFFIVLSRFEYALKKARYLKRNSEWAEPDWKEFADKNNATFNDTKSLIATSVNYLMQYPAKEQIVNDLSLGWKDIQFKPVHSFLWNVLKVVKTTRNNLFHGGKYPFVEIDEPSRNKILISNCISILDFCIELDEKVKEIYYNTI